LSLFFTCKESKKLLFQNNNIGMSNDNKLTNKFNIEDNLLQTD